MKKRLLWALMLTFLIGGGSLFTLAENITVATQDFDLGNGVIGKWNKDTQTLSIEGNGKIKDKEWRDLKGKLQLTGTNAEDVTISFAKDIQFPDDAFAFFYQVTSKNITFHPQMDTSNVTSMRSMFKQAINFNGDLSHWDTSNVTTMEYMFHCDKYKGKDCKFNGDLSNWNTSKVTNMAYMFANTSAFEGKGVWKWDVSKVKNVFQMFFNAKSFNWDISGWKLTWLVPTSEQKNPGKSFIDYHPDPVLSFSPENYDKLIEKRANELPARETPIDIRITVPYCKESTLTNKAKLKKKNYNIISPKKRDCQLTPGIANPEQEWRGSLTFIVSASSLRPVDDIKIKMVDKPDTPTHSELKNCKKVNLGSVSALNCQIEVTSTEKGRVLELEFTDGVTTKKATLKAFIDKEGPELPQVHIDTKQDMKDTTIALKQFPNDRWGAGGTQCVLSYAGWAKSVKIETAPWSKAIKDLEGLTPDGNWVYTINMQCEDRLWNKGEINEIKFPPIIEFSRENKTLIKKDIEFWGTFTIYSPNGNLIDAMEITNANDLGITSIKCQGTKDPTQSKKFSNELGWSELKGLLMQNDINNKIICEYKGTGTTSGKLAIKVGDDYWAEGKNSQSITIDDEWPSIFIESDLEEPISSGNIELTITITDDHKLDPNTVKVDGTPIDLTKCTENTPSKLVCPYLISGPIINKKITVTATDSVGHQTSSQSKEFTIDTGKPIITNKPVSYESNGTLAKVSFTVKDNDGGLGIDTDSLSYFFSKDNTCNEPELINPLNAWSAEPFSFDIQVKKDDYSTYTAKYLCLQAKDKVWNLTSVSLGELTFSTSSTPSTPSIPSTSQVGYSGGGGGSSMRRDNCPNGDFSASYYDGTCGTNKTDKKDEKADPQQDSKPTQEKKSYPESDLFNPTIEDGKCYTRRPHLGILTSQLIPTNDEYNKAQSFLWSYEMTKFDSVDGYDPYRNLSRQEAAKIFSNFAINVLCRQPNKKLTVNYSDTQESDPSLKPYIELAYQLGIMKGSGQGDGVFRPFEFISKAEVNAVLMRMLLKSYLDETGMLRYTPYNQASSALNIITQDAGLEPVARNHVALMLFRAYKQQAFDWKEIDYFSYVLKQRANFVK